MLRWFSIAHTGDEGISRDKSDNVLQRTLANKVLDIGPFQKVCGARLEGDRP